MGFFNICLNQTRKFIILVDGRKNADFEQCLLHHHPERSSLAGKVASCGVFFTLKTIHRGVIGISINLNFP